MKFEEQAAAFLDEEETVLGFDENAANAFLDGQEVEKPSIADPQPEPELRDGTKSIWQSAGDWAAGANDAVVRTLGLPADAANWALEKMGTDKRVYGTSEDVSRGMAAIGAGYEEGLEPDTGSYKAGNYTGTGLMFLAPWLKAGKGVLEAVKTGEAVQVGAGTMKGVSQRIAAPFVTAPKQAYLAELAGSTGAGFGAYYGGKHYGETGEMIGGLGGGFAGAVLPSLSVIPYAARTLKTSFFPYTKAGGKIKATQRLRSLAETIDIEETIMREQGKVLKGTKISPAKLSGDRHILALEKQVLKSDPELSHQFKLDEARVNAIARQEVEELGGDVPIEQTQAFLQHRVDRIKKLIGSSVSRAVVKSQETLGKMSPSQRRKSVNQIAGKQIDDALTVARGDEKALWQKVNRDVISETSELKSAYKGHLEDRAIAADPEEIPAYVTTFLGKLKNGQLLGGKFKNQESVKELTTFRSRILNTVRTEKAKEAPNWNKVRILNDLQDSVLKDIEKTPAAANLTEAIAFSRELNQKFSGGVMNSIMGHEKTGGKLASELTLEGVKNGPKAAVEINRILAASPKSQDVIEEYVKMQIAQSNVVRGGRVNLNPAKKYMVDNEDIMEIFPDLKRAMNHAISAEEKAKWLTDAAKTRLAKIESSLPSKLAKGKPKSFLSTVMTSPNPDKAMRQMVSKLNKTGKAGVKNDITDYLLGKAKTGQFDENNAPILSGRKFFNEIKNNRKVFGEILDNSEMKRLDVVAETMIKNEGLTDLPDIGGVIEAARTPLSWALEVVAVRAGSKMGAKTHGAALKTASMAGSVAKKILGDLDTGRARQLIKDAIQDPELFKELITDHTTQVQIARFYKVYHGWLMAHAVQNIDENN